MTNDLEAALALTAARREPATDLGLRVVRRSHPGGDHLFVANLAAITADGWACLGHDARSVLVLDPMTGRTGVAPTRISDGRRCGSASRRVSR